MRACFSISTIVAARSTALLRSPGRTILPVWHRRTQSDATSGARRVRMGRISRSASVTSRPNEWSRSGTTRPGPTTGRTSVRKDAPRISHRSSGWKPGVSVVVLPSVTAPRSGSATTIPQETAVGSTQRMSGPRDPAGRRCSHPFRLRRPSRVARISEMRGIKTPTAGSVSAWVPIGAQPSPSRSRALALPHRLCDFRTTLPRAVTDRRRRKSRAPDGSPGESP